MSAARECEVSLNSNECTAWPGSDISTRATCYRCGQAACPGCSRRIKDPHAGARVRICEDCAEDARPR